MISNAELIDYLNQRRVNDNTYREFVQNYRPENYNFTLCSLNGFDYMVSHFLDKSEEAGFGLIATNELLKTEKFGQLAIGLIEGDDVICLDPQTGHISLWMIQSSYGEFLVAAKSFQDFINFCCEN